MSASCIHGFPEGQCASCRRCPHGLATGRCGRCIAAAAVPLRRSVAIAGDVPASEERGGFEIFYVPELSGWQYRDPDDRTSSVSYRSLFLARKAVDEAAERIAAKAGAGKAAAGKDGDHSAGTAPTA